VPVVLSVELIKAVVSRWMLVISTGAEALMPTPEPLRI
jgi:hypothetical protein